MLTRFQRGQEFLARAQEIEKKAEQYKRLAEQALGGPYV
jgi:hypothetical protein